MQTIISTGDTFRVYHDMVVSHEILPVGTYRVMYDELTGHTLERIDNTYPTERIYGSHVARADHMFQMYHSIDRPLGVILSGDKGMGKSLTVRYMMQSAHNAGIPVILVEKNSPDLPRYLDKWGEAMLVFEEFDKAFYEADEYNETAVQETLLGLFDGASAQKRMYVVVANDVTKLSQYILNRPGRFHYHLRFTYPTESDIREYLYDACGDVSADDMAAVLQLTSLVPLNYDHLRAIALEINMGSVMADVINDLNIKPSLVGNVPVIGTLTIPNGQAFSVHGNLRMSDFSAGPRTITQVRLEEAGADVRFYNDDCTIVGPERFVKKYEITGLDSVEAATYMGGVLALRTHLEDIYSYQSDRITYAGH